MIIQEHFKILWPERGEDSCRPDITRKPFLFLFTKKLLAYVWRSLCTVVFPKMNINKARQEMVPNQLTLDCLIEALVRIKVNVALIEKTCCK